MGGAHPPRSDVGRSGSAVIWSGGGGGAGPHGVDRQYAGFHGDGPQRRVHHVELLARRDFAGLGDLDGATGWDAARWQTASARYFAEHNSIGLGGDARSSGLFHLQANGRKWEITQTLDDPDGNRDWVLRLEADLDASDAVGEAVLTMAGFGQL